MPSDVKSELVGRIIDRILMLSQFSHNHESWWTLQDLMGEAVWEEEDAEMDEGIVELFQLIQDDAPAMRVLRMGYELMKINNGDWKGFRPNPPTQARVREHRPVRAHRPTSDGMPREDER